MAKTKAQSASRTLVWGILLLIIVGLGGFGAVNFRGNVRSVGSVGDSPVTTSRYARQLQQDIARVQSQMGPDFNFAQAQAFGLDHLALEKVVAQVALENEAATLGLSVGDAAVQRQLVSLPDFQDFQGKFDVNVYRDTLKRAGLGIAEFEGELRAEQARLILQSAIAGGSRMNPAYVSALYSYAGERRSFTWTELSADSLTVPVADPADADLKTWYDAHPEAYTLPEARAITYAWITPTMLVPKVPVDEAALKTLYEQRASTYNQPERRLIERLVFADTAEAQIAWNRLQKGEIDFEALVAEKKLTLDDIDLGDVTKADLGPAGDAAFALTEPGLVGPVETDLGPAILRMNGILAATETPYDEARPELQEYATEAAKKTIGDMVEPVEDLFAGGATIEEAADQTDLDIGKIELSPDSTDPIAGYAAFRDAAAKAAEDDFPQVIHLDDGGIVALRLDNVIPPRLQPFDEVKSRVAEDWKTDAVKAALEKLADELLPRLANGEPMESFGLAVNTETAVTRDTPLADTPKDLLTAAFALKQGEAKRIAGTEGTTTVAIVRLAEVLPPDPANTDLIARRDAFAVQLDQDLGVDLVEAFTRAVEASAGIKLDSAAVNAVNASFR